MVTKIRATVVVTQPEYENRRAEFDRAEGEGISCVPAQRDEQGLAATIRHQKARHVICGLERYSGEFYEALPRGGVIARFGVGFDSIDLAKAKEHGLLCTNTPGALDESVAEHTIALILSAARNLNIHDEGTKCGLWLAKTGIELSRNGWLLLGPVELVVVWQEWQH